MANLIKTKASITVLSVLTVLLIPLLESNFGVPVVLKEWTQLTWNDFQGIPRPFSKYDAVISSDLYLTYDSSLNRYRAYSAQDNVDSWVKNIDSAALVDNFLRHEQYHFNIAELFARRIDRAIVANASLDVSVYTGELEVAKGNNNKMQDKYDNETAHGSFRHRQKNWEFRIDSLMQRDRGWLVDRVSGASVFLPASGIVDPTETSNINVSNSRSYHIDAYDLTFNMTSTQYESFSESQIEFVKEFLLKDTRAKLIRDEKNKYFHKTYFRSADSAGLITYSAWIQREKSLHHVSASFRAFMGDTLGYYMIANSVLGSFGVIDEDDLRKTRGN